MLERYYLDYVKRQYTGKVGANFVEFVTWNYAKGIFKNKDFHSWPGKPDFDAWFGKSETEIKLGIEVKTKKSLENCVIDDKVLYNLIRCQNLNNEERKDVILVFLIWDMQKMFYIPLTRLCRDIDIDDMRYDWSKEILSPKGDIINAELLNFIDERLSKMCNGVSTLTNNYSSRQVNKVFDINPNRLKIYPYDFLREYAFDMTAKLDNVDLQLLLQYYLECRKWLQTSNVKIIYENVQRIKSSKTIRIPSQLEFESQP